MSRENNIKKLEKVVCDVSAINYLKAHADYYLHMHDLYKNSAEEFKRDLGEDSIAYKFAKIIQKQYADKCRNIYNKELPTKFSCTR